MAREAWRPCPGYPDLYRVSDRGRVRNCETGRTLKPAATGEKGYLVVWLSRGNPSRATGVVLARLVARAFLGPSPRPSSVVGYRNDDPTDCRAENLIWTTRAKVARRRFQPEEIRAIRSSDEPLTALARRHGVSRRTIRMIQRRESYPEIA
jgi:hypothetical protein